MLKRKPMFDVFYENKKAWPKLAWVAQIDMQAKSICVFHGSMLEIGDEWAVEGVWDGDFKQGGFDKTDFFYGSGLRKRDGKIVFVSSSTGVDRLWYVNDKTIAFIGNTLPGLLAVSKISLDTTYKTYQNDLNTVQTRGISSYVNKIKANPKDLCVVYFKNVVLHETGFIEVDKTDITPPFLDYASYVAFLNEKAVLLGQNALDSSRKFKIEMLVGLSSGYDSIATAIVAKSSGCEKSVSIVNASSLWRGSDSGSFIAKKLGLACQLVKHNKNAYNHELSIWANTGGSGGRNLTLFEYPKPLCLFFSGGYGDIIWDRNHCFVKEPKGGVNEMLCEFRLAEGVFVTVVPWWGIKRAKQIQELNHLNEMNPWVINTNYDRPVARRMIEEAGIQRGQFAQSKKNTASNQPFLWPSTKEAHDKFNLYLVKCGMRPRSRFEVKFISFACLVIKLINSNLLKFAPEAKKWKPWLKSPERHMFFVWANSTLRDEYYRN